MDNIISLLIAFILGICANYVYDQLRWKFRKSKGVHLSKILEDAENWVTTGGEIYFYSKDPDYNIAISPGQDNLSQRFKIFPDREHDQISWVEVRFKDVSLFGWNFMHLDGYRYFIPVPEAQIDSNNEYYDFYNLNSLQFKVFNIIGSADLLPGKFKIDSLKAMAKMMKIVITEI